MPIMKHRNIVGTDLPARAEGRRVRALNSTDKIRAYIFYSDFRINKIAQLI